MMEKVDELLALALDTEEKFWKELQAVRREVANMDPGCDGYAGLMGDIEDAYVRSQGFSTPIDQLFRLRLTCVKTSSLSQEDALLLVQDAVRDAYRAVRHISKTLKAIARGLRAYVRQDLTEGLAVRLEILADTLPRLPLQGPS